jgi:subtilisin-like proprotein convertase family protein
MKKIFTLLFSIPLFVTAQTFTINTNTLIPDNNTYVYVPITVSGLPAVIDTNFGVVSSCINITHTFVSDLEVYLTSPFGTTITLSSHNGGAGEGYWSTCFREDGVNGWITSGVSPFPGTYYPQQSLNSFNNVQNPNGVWNLIVRDAVPVDTGSVHYWSITFGANPPKDPTGSSGPCSELNPAACKCADVGSTNCDLLPDMTASAQSIRDDGECNA